MTNATDFQKVNRKYAVEIAENVANEFAEHIVWNTLDYYISEEGSASLSFKLAVPKKSFEEEMDQAEAEDLFKWRITDHSGIVPAGAFFKHVNVGEVKEEKYSWIVDVSVYQGYNI